MTIPRLYLLHAAIVAAWLLLVPPSSYDPTFGKGNRFDTSRPLSEWIKVGEYPSQPECEVQRLEMMNVIALGSPGNDMPQRLSMGQCVEK